MLGALREREQESDAAEKFSGSFMIRNSLYSRLKVLPRGAWTTFSHAGAYRINQRQLFSLSSVLSTSFQPSNPLAIFLQRDARPLPPSPSV